MKRLKNKIVDFFAILIGALVFILFLPFILISIPFDWIKQRKVDKEFKEYLLSLGDKNFFCYNNRTEAKDFIEKELLPKLNDQIEVIYLEGREPKSKFVKNFISLALYRLKNYNKFPHLFKVRNGELMDESINNEFYNTMNQNKPLDKLLQRVNLFFDLTEEKKNAA